MNRLTLLIQQQAPAIFCILTIVLSFVRKPVTEKLQFHEAAQASHPLARK